MVSSSGEQVASRGFTDMYRRFLDIGARLDFPDMTLATILLALRSILWPYRGLVHDARLYAFQAFNHSQSGKFGQDLFFAFGSQDNYSVFSPLMSPLVSWFGLKAAFWVVYMLASALLIYAEVRLVRRLVPDRSLANLCLVALAAIDLPYVGWGSLHVHESFLTARLPAQGLSLLGIEAILEKRWLRALGFTLAGLALHPLMAIGVLAALVVVFFWYQLRNRMPIDFLMLIVGLGTILLLLHWQLVNPLSFLGVMDESWFASVYGASWHCFLSKWRILDWYWLIGSLALVLGAWKWLEPRARILVGAVVLVSLGGLTTTAVGEFLRSPLLLQGQGHRSLWLIELLAVPLGVLVACRLSGSATAYAHLGVLGVMVILGDPFILNLEILPFIPFFVPLLFLISWFGAFLLDKRSTVTRADAIWNGSFAGLLSTAVILSALVAIAAVELGLTLTKDPIELLYAAGISSSHLVWFTASLLVLWTFSYVVQNRKKTLVFAASVWIFVSVATIILQENPRWREQFQPGYSDLKFIANFLADNRSDKAEFSKGQIYWPVDPTLIWFDLQRDSYYHFVQVWGIIFSQETAVEGQRRALLVRPFEVAQMRMGNLTQSSPSLLMHLGFLGATFQDRPPNREDLLRLAADERLDWIVLNERFDGLYIATNGSVFIYDCGLIRSSEGK